VCDLVHLERRGIPAVGVATTPFADEAVEQLLTAAELDDRADAVFGAIVAALTDSNSPS
jgi:hypothetical protein